MNKFLNSACSFWKAGCCCVRTVENKEKTEPTIERPDPRSQAMNIENDEDDSKPNDRRESVKKSKFRKEESPPRQKRQIKTWTPEEDQLLATYYKKLGANNWNEVAKHIPGRNGSQCSQRWRRKFKPDKVRKNWTVEEDNLLLDLVGKYGQNWQLISNQMKGTINRTGKQVRERYLNKLDPKIVKEPFSEEEDLIIVKEYERIGKKWSEIAKCLKGRPENAVKNRFYSYIKRKILKENSDKGSRGPSPDLMNEEEANENENENGENEDNDNDDNESSDQEQEVENMIIEERPELENRVTLESEPNETNHATGNVISIAGIKTMNSSKLATSGTFENANLPLYNPNEPQQNNSNSSNSFNHRHFEQNNLNNNSGSARMEIEDMSQFGSNQHHQYKMSLEEKKVSYDYNELYKLNMIPYDSNGLSYKKGFSTETDKLLKSNNTFEKLDSRSYNDIDHQILKLKVSDHLEAGNNIKQEEFLVENYINDERK